MKTFFIHSWNSICNKTTVLDKAKITLGLFLVYYLYVDTLYCIWQCKYIWMPKRLQFGKSNINIVFFLFSLYHYIFAGLSISEMIISNYLIVRVLETVARLRILSAMPFEYQNISVCGIYQCIHEQLFKAKFFSKLWSFQVKRYIASAYP